MKNSYLSKEEFEENKEYIEDIILMERIMIIAEGINKNKTTGVKLAKTVGISVDEIYEWYVCGKDGEERFRIFSQIFELGVVLPRVLAFKKARDIGIPVKFLNKSLKKTWAVQIIGTGRSMTSSIKDWNSLKMTVKALTRKKLRISWKNPNYLPSKTEKSNLKI